MRAKETAMIELNAEQQRALDEAKSPLHLVGPRTGQVYVLVRQDVYNLTCSIVGGGPGQVWDDSADDDLIRKRP
jgi:hypothetical protein